MNDMSETIIAKSDQINAADLIGTTRTVTVREVRIKAGDDQPVTILIEDDKKSFRPCKGMRRLIVRVWGADANQYIGKSMTLFCDPTVKWAGKPEGGIRISHMTGLDEKIVEFVRISKEKTKPYEVLPLNMEAQAKPKPDTKARDAADKFIATLNRAPDLAKLETYAESKAGLLASLAHDAPDIHAECQDALKARREELFTDTPDDDPFAD